ncbi:unnamed protein product [Moneuplotes crassus]|uniref:Uncharacterized protein n=1 Tax=Euplotes crassus TaxID=5936 RepID=A0AAD1X893_EUPCR|nr:unnamed protein product [Moneuplotes crassus]
MDQELGERGCRDESLSDSEEQLEKVRKSMKEYMRLFKERLREERGRGEEDKGCVEQPNDDSYVCHRCDERGHFIHDCPTNGDPLFDEEKGYQDSPGAVAFKIQKQVEEKLNGICRDDKVVYKPFLKSQLMPEFCCQICQDIFKNPGLMPCCGINYCWECIISQISPLRGYFSCPNCDQATLVDISSEILTKNIVMNNLLNRLSQLYKRELQIGTHIKEIEISKYSVENLSQVQEISTQNITEFDQEKLLEEYQADEEDYKAIMEILNLENIDIEPEVIKYNAKQEKFLQKKTNSLINPNPTKALRVMQKTSDIKDDFCSILPHIEEEELKTDETDTFPDLSDRFFVNARSYLSCNMKDMVDNKLSNKASLKIYSTQTRGPIFQCENQIKSSIKNRIKNKKRKKRRNRKKKNASLLGN